MSVVTIESLSELKFSTKNSNSCTEGSSCGVISDSRKFFEFLRKSDAYPKDLISSMLDMPIDDVVSQTKYVESVLKNETNFENSLVQLSLDSKDYKQLTNILKK